MLIEFLHHKAGAKQQPFWKLLFLSKKDKELPNPEWWEELFWVWHNLNTGKFIYLKMKVSCLYQVLHTTEGANNLYTVYKCSSLLLLMVKRKIDGIVIKIGPSWHLVNLGHGCKLERLDILDTLWNSEQQWVWEKSTVVGHRKGSGTSGISVIVILNTMAVLIVLTWFQIVSSHRHPAPYYLSSVKLFLISRN